MKFHIMTLFPDYVDRALGESIIGRARKNGLIEVNCVNIRDFAEDKYGHVDDTPYGGGKGMILMPGPVYRCYQSIISNCSGETKCIYMSPAGEPFKQAKAFEYSKLDNLIILCGHYEGVDQRVIDEICDGEISVGDYVLTGGELAACIVTDCVSRLIPGVLSDEECYMNESHIGGLLEAPQYTRPEEFMGRKVPDVLLGGNHSEIEKYRFSESVKKTSEKRPDLLD